MATVEAAPPAPPMADDAAASPSGPDGSKKRSAEEALGGGGDACANDTTSKKAKQDEEPREAANLSTEEKLVLLKKQIEYYLSDENMKTDRFFHNKISNDSDNFLDVQNILSCKKVQQLNASKDDIFKALEGSHLETRPEADGKFAGVRRKEPLPPLEPGAGRRPLRPFEKRPRVKVSKSSPTTPQNIHNLGCLVKVADIPSEVSWSKIKEAFFKALEAVVPADVVPENRVQRKEPKNASGHPSYSKFIRFVSPVTPAAECHLYCRKFVDDKKFIETITEIEIEGAKLGVALVDNVDTAINFFETQLSPLLKKERDREYNRAKCELLNKAIMLGGTRFNNVDHLRKCYKELLEVTPLDTEVKPAAFTVLRALLEYHPRAADKCEDIVSIKVGQRSDVPDTKNGKNRCFFLVRSDGSSEDFSTNKCMDNLSMNPPLAPPKAPVPKKEETVASPANAEASPSTSSTAEDTPSQKETPAPSS